MPAGVNAFIPLANITLGSAQATVTFSSISGAYRDLRVVVSNATGALVLRVNINNDVSTTSYFSVVMAGDGTSTVSSSSSGYAYMENHVYASYNQWYYDFLDYSATDKHKSVLVRISDAGSAVQASTGRWASTSAVTSIKFTAFSNFPVGATLSLYGIVG